MRSINSVMNILGNDHFKLRSGYYMHDFPRWAKLVVFAVFLGLGVNAFGKAVKYSLFDPTKEMAYIPLDPELKTKGKAAVDVIGGRGGKSGGAYIQIGLLTAFAGSALYQLVHIIAPILIIVVFFWILSVFGLSKKFKALTHGQG